MEGRACIPGIRVNVCIIVGQIGAGRTIKRFWQIFVTLNVRMCFKRFSTLRCYVEKILIDS